MSDEEWIPDACTLPSADRPARLEQFDSLFSDGLTGLRRTGTDTATFQFATGHGARVRSLTAAESQCCSFFRFATTEHSEGTALTVTVPASQTTVLDGLTKMAGRHLAAD